MNSGGSWFHSALSVVSVAACKSTYHATFTSPLPAPEVTKKNNQSHVFTRYGHYHFLHFSKNIPSVEKIGFHYGLFCSCQILPCLGVRLLRDFLRWLGGSQRPSSAINIPLYVASRTAVIQGHPVRCVLSGVGGPTKQSKTNGASLGCVFSKNTLFTMLIIDCKKPTELNWVSAQT